MLCGNDCGEGLVISNYLIKVCQILLSLVTTLISEEVKKCLKENGCFA